jgi:hypothetical protein
VGRGLQSYPAALVARISNPANDAGIIIATGSTDALEEGYLHRPVAPTAPIAVSKTAEALIAAG